MQRRGLWRCRADDVLGIDHALRGEACGGAVVWFREGHPPPRSCGPWAEDLEAATVGERFPFQAERRAPAVGFEHIKAGAEVEVVGAPRSGRTRWGDMPWRIPHRRRSPPA